MTRKDVARLRRTLSWLRTVGVVNVKKGRECVLNHEYTATYAGHAMRLTVAVLFDHTWIRLGQEGGFNWMYISVDDTNEDIYVLDLKQKYEFL